MFARIKKSGRNEYLQLVENRREGKKITQRVVATIGRMDELRAGGDIETIIRSLSRFSEKVLLVFSAKGNTDVQARAKKIGPPLVCEPLVEYILKTTLDGFLLVDSTTALIIDVNEAACTMLGYTHEELLSLHITEIGTYWSREQIDSEIQKVKNFGSAIFETRHSTKTGKIIDVEVSVTYLSTTSLFCLLIRDISKRKQSEKALKESENKYRFLATTLDSLVVLDRDCHYLFVNDAYLDIIGMEETSIIGRHYGEFHHDDSTKLIINAVKYVFNEAKSYQDECLGHRSGKYWLRAFCPVMDGEGNISAVIIAHKDITQRKRAEDTRKLLESLTPREHEVFGFVVQGCLNKQIAYQLGITEKTIKVHRARIMQKMGATSLADLVHISERLN